MSPDSRDRSSARLAAVAPLFNPSSAMAEVTGNFFFSGGPAPRKLENDAPGENWKQRFGKPKNRAGWYGRARTRARTHMHSRETVVGVRANAKKPGLNK